MTDQQIKDMTERFLSWKLPQDFSPDAGISFQPEYNGGRHEPTGTNLLSYTQAKEMVQYIANRISIQPSPHPTHAELVALIEHTLDEHEDWNIPPSHSVARAILALLAKGAK